MKFGSYISFDETPLQEQDDDSQKSYSLNSEHNIDEMKGALSVIKESPP
jgi:hypothetical protein